MAEKRYGLTKQESDRLNSLLSVAQIQQELLDAITQRYREFILGIFKRLEIKAELFPFSKVDLGRGELIIAEPEKLPIKSKKVEVKGETKDAN